MSNAGDLDPRLVNRLGAAALLLADAVREAAEPRPLVEAEALVGLLNFGDGRRIDALRRALTLSQPGVAHLVSRLEREGLAARERDPRDGRGVLVRLTVAGRREARRLVAARDGALRARLGALEPAEQPALLALLDRVLADATRSRDDACRLCRLCDGDGCGHPRDCPVTLAADALEP